MDLKKFSSPKKKELTKKQQTARTVLGWVSSIICIVVIIFALVVAIFTIAGATNERHLTQFGSKIYMNVASDSMSPTFNKNDMIIVDAFDPSTQAQSLKVGQVITFETNIGGVAAFNTHRVMKLEYGSDGVTIIGVRTRGDAKGGNWQDALSDTSSWDSATVYTSKIVATWGSVDDQGNFKAGSMLKGVAGFTNWIQDVDHPGEDSSAKVRFFCIVVLPLILLFVIYAFVLIRTLVIAKLENAKPVDSEQVVSVDSLSDEDKKRLAEEYLASLARQQSAQADDVAPNDAALNDAALNDAPNDVVDDVASEDKE